MSPATGAGAARGEVLSARLEEPALERWGRTLGEVAARERVFVALYGPLGAGKTTLVRAACAGGGVRGVVTSPTFTLVQEYGAERPVYHADLYRIERERELVELGWDDLTSGEAAVFVEWADRAGSALPDDRWDIRLSIAPGGAARDVEARREGAAPPIPDPGAATGVGPGARGPT